MINIVDNQKAFSALTKISKPDFALRDNFADINGKSKLMTNHFAVNIEEGATLYVYSIGNLPEKTTKAQKKTLIKRMIDHSAILSHNIADIASDY